MKKLGLVGGGLAVRDLHVPALRKLGMLEWVTAVATSTERGSKETAEWLRGEGATNCVATAFDSLLEDDGVDALLIAVPIAITADLAERALQAGKAVLVEKPVATSVGRANELLKLAASLRVPLLAGENFRFKPEFGRMRELASEGLIGDVRLIFWNDLHFTPSSGKYAKTDWRIRGDHAGGYLVDGGTHIVAGLRQLTSAAVRSVHGVATSTQPYLSAQDDALLINMQFSDGTIGHLALGYGVHDPEARHPKICGTSGTLSLMDDGIYLTNVSGTALLEDRHSSPGFAEEWELLLAALDSPTALRETHRLTLESIRDLQLIEGARSSSMTGQTVSLESVGE